jgi:hypothetical protein
MSTKRILHQDPLTKCGGARRGRLKLTQLMSKKCRVESFQGSRQALWRLMTMINNAELIEKGQLIIEFQLNAKKVICWSLPINSTSLPRLRHLRTVWEAPSWLILRIIHPLSLSKWIRRTLIKYLTEHFQKNRKLTITSPPTDPWDPLGFKNSPVHEWSNFIHIELFP